MLTPEGDYYNFSGCGNTLNCNHPVVQQMILECLRHWVIHYRVDGFRFDLASIFGTKRGRDAAVTAASASESGGRSGAEGRQPDCGGMGCGRFVSGRKFPAWNRWAE